MLNKVKRSIKLVLPKYQKLILDYPITMKPRYGYGLKPHPILYDIVNREVEVYKKFINEILKFEDVFKSIKSKELESNENLPSWNNGYLPGLDIVTLYTMMAYFKPKNYIEVGSGNSTKVAKKSILDNNLSTEITSIDPFPRANIDHLSDVVIRQPFENLNDYSYIVNKLGGGDILFVDNSHRCLPNSDATALFFDLLPYLKKGVIVHVHDIYIPYDYPQFMCDRFYSEQYVLAAFLLANPEKYKPIFPCIFVSENKELSSSLSQLWNHPNTKNVEPHGGSFWFEIN